MDITERKNLESELKKHRDQLEHLVDTRTSDLQKRKSDLKERVKELNCLFKISELINIQNIKLPEIYQGVVDLIPPSLRYPEITSVHLSIFKDQYLTANFTESQWKLESPITINTETIGYLKVYYNKEKSQADMGPFLKEESALLEIITERIGKITERMITEKALIKSEEKYRNFLEKLGDIAYETDLNGNITYCNRITEEATGKPLKDIINNPFLPLFAEKDQKTATDAYQRTLKGAKTTFELTFKNGRIFQYKAEQLLDCNNNVIGIFGTGRDITNKKSVEKELKKSKEKFRIIFDNATDGMVLVEPKTKNFVLANKEFCKMLGYKKKEIIKIGVFDIHPSEDIPYVMEQFRKQTLGESTLARKLRVKKKNGNIFYADINAKIVDLDDKPYMLGIFRETINK